MSLFSKVLIRAAVPGGPQPTPAWPKGRAMPVRRQEAEEEPASPLRRTASLLPMQRVEAEEEAAQPMRRAEEEEAVLPLQRQEEEEAQPLRRVQDEERAQPLRRQEEEEPAAHPLHRQEEEEEEEEEIQTLRRQEEEEALQTLRRQEEEEEVAAPLHRQEAEDGGPLQTLRRQEEEEEEMQTLRRAAGAMETIPAEPMPATEDGPDEELPDLRALRRDARLAATGNAAPEPSAGAVSQAADSPAVGDLAHPPTAMPPDPHPAGLPLAGHAGERPRVTIDQIDVVIHEDAPARTASGPSLSDLSRRVNALYLRGL